MCQEGKHLFFQPYSHYLAWDLAINRPSILLCPYYQKEGKNRIADRKNIRGRKNRRATLAQWLAKAIQCWCSLWSRLHLHEVMEWEPKLHPASSFLSNRWRHWPHTCRVEAEWVLGLKPSALLAPTACSRYACTLWGTSGHRHLNQWLLWSFSELQTHVDNLLLDRTFWTAQTQSETNALSSLCLLYFWTLPLSDQHPGLHSEASRIFQDAPWSSPYLISGIYHQICWFASSLLPKSESTSPPPSPEIQATITAYHPSSLDSYIHGPLLPVYLLPCRQSEVPNCQSDPASPCFKIPDELLIAPTAKAANPRRTCKTSCLPPSPAVLSASAEAGVGGFQPWNVWCAPRSGLFWVCAFCSEFFSYLLVIYLFGCARS